MLCLLLAEEPRQALQEQEKQQQLACVSAYKAAFDATC